jgi:hypothetical protein
MFARQQDNHNPRTANPAPAKISSLPKSLREAHFNGLTIYFVMPPKLWKTLRLRSGRKIIWRNVSSPLFRNYPNSPGSYF